MNIVVIDDDKLVALSLKTILESTGNITVSATGSSGAEASALYREHRPDVLLMDIRMEGMNGIEAGEALLKEFPEAKILYLTTFSDDEYIIKALNMGAKGYILKQDFEGIAPALEAVARGQSVFGERIIGRLPELMKQKEEFDFAAHGISDKEILINAPLVTDLNAQDYASSQSNLYRYNVTSIITVTSRQVDRVRSIIARQGEMLKEGVAIVDGGYNNPVVYEYTAFKKLKPLMMKEAIKNAEQTAAQFAENSQSKINKIINADQGQFTIEDRDATTPYIKKVRVVTSVTYSLKD